MDFRLRILQLFIINFRCKTLSIQFQIMKPRKRLAKSEIDEVEISLHPQSDDKCRVEPLCSARIWVHRMRHRKAETVSWGPDVETLASNRQIHLTSWFPWQLHTHHHILAARSTCSLASHLKHQHLRVYYIFYAHGVKRDRMLGWFCPSVRSPVHIFYIRNHFKILTEFIIRYAR